MSIVQTIESAAHTAVEAVEHPFLTIGARLKAAGEHIATFLGHPYAAPPLQDALTTLHGVVVDLAQEVAELRVPCPCKPAPTASTTVESGDAGQAPAGDDAEAAAKAAVSQTTDGVHVVMGAAELADYEAWKRAKAGAAAFTGQA